jgi:hypothetical protein
MRQIADFLEIEPLPSLLEPTIAGRPAVRNSSFGASRPEIGEVLDPFDQVLLALAVGRDAAKLGYKRRGESGVMGHPIVGSHA